MPRVCNLEGCGKRLATKTGAPDFRKHFCSREHKNLDSKERMAARRKHLHGRKCRLCGRRADSSAGVSQDTAHQRRQIASVIPSGIADGIAPVIAT